MDMDMGMGMTMGMDVAAGLDLATITGMVNGGRSETPLRRRWWVAPTPASFVATCGTSAASWWYRAWRCTVGLLANPMPVLGMPVLGIL